MDVELVDHAQGGNPNVYQVENKDLIDIGNNSFRNDFDAANVEKIAITTDDYENIARLDMFPYRERISKETDVEDLFPKKMRMGEPTILAPSFSRTDPEIHVPLVRVEKGDQVAISGHQFVVIIYKHVFGDGSAATSAAYYNEEYSVLFSGDIITLIESNLDGDSFSQEGERMIEKFQMLDIEVVYPTRGEILNDAEFRERLDEIRSQI